MLESERRTTLVVGFRDPVLAVFTHTPFPEVRLWNNIEVIVPVSLLNCNARKVTHYFYISICLYSI